ncbi:MAG: GspE/PulE family protein [bacterium]
MIACEELVQQLRALHIMPETELDRYCQQRSDDLLGLLDEIQIRHPAHKDTLGRIWADALNVAYVNIQTTLVDSHVASRLNIDFALREEIIALYEFDGVVTLAASHPENIFMEERVSELLGLAISVVFAFPSQIIDAIEMAYQSSDSLTALIAQSGINELAGQAGVLTTEQMEQLAGSEFVIKFVRGLILLALSERASDIHIEPGERGVRIRFRIDGELEDRFRLESAVLGPVVSRLKILADVDIAECRLPQDGRIGLELRENVLDLRFSSMPSIYGEKVVLRLLGQSQWRAIPDMDQLQFSATTYKNLSRTIQTPNGIFFVTGPTGSGKTTTLYALIKQINTTGVNILTIEDPVEYRLEGITQVQVNPHTGLDFSLALRAFLRQDPDVILVGEIRDAESGRIAAQAALTGHFVLATMHTNSAVQSITRLLDIGVESFLVAPSIIAVMAQRLVRQVCATCRESYPAPQKELDENFINTEGEEVRFWRGGGCPQCHQTGYYGRVAVHELFVVNDEIRNLIAHNATIIELKAAAKRTGFLPMRYDGLKKVLRGLTTLEQVNAISYYEDLPVSV